MGFFRLKNLERHFTVQNAPRGLGKVEICKGLFATIFDDGADLLQSAHKEGICIYPIKTPQQAHRWWTRMGCTELWTISWQMWSAEKGEPPRIPCAIVLFVSKYDLHDDHDFHHHHHHHHVVSTFTPAKFDYVTKKHIHLTFNLETSTQVLIFFSKRQGLLCVPLSLKHHKKQAVYLKVMFNPPPKNYSKP